MSVKCSYAASAGQLSAWYGSARTDMEWDDNQEPTAADHGDVLYDIGEIRIISNYFVTVLETRKYNKHCKLCHKRFLFKVRVFSIFEKHSKGDLGLE